MPVNSLEGNNTRGTIYGVHMELGVELSEGDIIGATPRGKQARGKSHMPIIISYNLPETRNKVLRAANAKGRQGPPGTLGDMAPFFTEVPSPRPKRNKYPKNPKKARAMRKLQK